MKIEHTEVYGFQAAFRGMRNPFDSWDKSDSSFWGPDTREMRERLGFPNIFVPEIPVIGSGDLSLACKLIRMGGDHRKFLRMIMVWCDFVVPRYLWQEIDTYKVATVRNSCSTMNTLGRRHVTQEDFETPVSEVILRELNKAVDDFQSSGDKTDVRVKLKNDLPEGFLQRATYLMSYETVFRMFHSRSNHRLPMWSVKIDGSICSWILSLPYMKEFVIDGSQYLEGSGKITVDDNS
jgi:hypothetical protein